MTPKVALHTLGCKLNFTETATIGRQLKEVGFETVPFDQPADVYVLNTCSVTDNADKKCRHLIRKVLSQNEEAKVVIVGCYAQLKPKEIASIPGVDLVLGAAEKFNLVAHLAELSSKLPEGKYISSDVCNADFFVNSWSVGERTRAFLKVQDGCDYNCSFCTIPLARGSSRSDSIESVLINAREIASNGIKEIVLTGVNLGDFGKGKHGGRKNEETFYDLVQALDEIEGIERFRISSIEPNLLSDEIIRFVAQSKRFVPHFHIPLQSGSDVLLRDMRRRYRTDLYQSRVKTIKEIMPHCCIGVDVIVGFPGESDEIFEDSYRFLNELDVSYLHVFTYSERANTHAITLESVVPMHLRRERSKMLRILSEKKRRHFYNQNIGDTRTVLFEDKEKEGQMNGFTDNYVKVTLPYDAALVNQIKPVVLRELLPNGMVSAKIVNEVLAN